MIKNKETVRYYFLDLLMAFFYKIDNFEAMMKEWTAPIADQFDEDWLKI